MSYDQEQLERLAANPAEGLNVELKRWLDPKDPEGIAKIVRACLALWNNNGGLLLIGFTNDGKPSSEGMPTDPTKTYHVDIVQGLVCKYSSYPFEIAVRFVERDGIQRPIVCVASGVRTPVASKGELLGVGKTLIKDNAVYVRTLNANNRASTSEAKRGDWDRLIEICMDNREADVARFIRRHLSDENLSKIRDLLGLNVSPQSDDDERLGAFHSNFRQDGLDETLNRGAHAFSTVVKDKPLKLPDHGAFEAAVWVCGNIKTFSANESFLNLIMASNPHYTGWPFWVDTRSFVDTSSRPYPTDGGWQALIVGLAGNWTDSLDFWRAEPKGFFYHRRGLEDDVKAKSQGVQPLTILDWSLTLWRVGEVIGTGLAFARAMGCTTQLTQVGVKFRWTRLKGRVLQSWTQPDRLLMSSGPAHDDSLVSSVTVPLETADTLIFAYVHEATKPLFELFGGKEIAKGMVESVISRMFTRKA